MISNYYSSYLGLTDALCHESLTSLYTMWFSTDHFRNWLKTNVDTGQVYVRTIVPSKWENEMNTNISTVDYVI